MNVAEYPSIQTGVGNLMLTKKILRKALTWTAVYFWGYFGLGLGWLTVPLVLSTLRWFSITFADVTAFSCDHFRYLRRKERELKMFGAQCLASAKEKEVISVSVVWGCRCTIKPIKVIQARVRDLPSWVFFPDFERAEWLNRWGERSRRSRFKLIKLSGIWK